MRKIIILTLVLMLGLAVNMMAEECTAHKGDAQTTAAVATTPATATYAGVELDPSKCCPDYQGKCELICLDIKGMTCTGCEEAITKALGATDGVIKVMAVDYKEGAGVVAIDPDKVQQEKVLEAINGLGYKAKVLPQVSAHAGCSPTKAAECMKTGFKCPSQKTAETMKTEEKKDAKTATE